MLVLPNSTQQFARFEAGGKGYNLFQISRLGLSVPEWVVLGKSVYDNFLSTTGLQPVIQDLLTAFVADRADAKQVSTQIRETILAQEVSPDIVELVEKAYETIGRDNMIAVRSSAADEDGHTHSYAGQLSSYLYISGIEDATRYLQLCWASGYSERCLLYRKEKGITFEGISIAVVFQRMLDPECSGVLFTCDPIKLTLDSFLISAVYGVGEGLVSGSLDADTYWLSSIDGEMTRKEIADKKTAYRRASSGGCSPVEVQEQLVSAPCLSQPQLEALFHVGKRLLKKYNSPQDVEWAIDDGELYFLQTRPVTAIDINLSGFPNLWDNSNIVESYGGITSPLSFSFALENYKNVYVQFCEILSVPRRVVKDMEYYLGNMLGCINGRVYYNLYNWYKLVGVLPGFKQNREFMETMMGVGEQLSDEIALRIQPHPSWDTLLGKFRKLKTGIVFFYYHLRIQALVDNFLKNFHHHYDIFRKKEYAAMTSDQVFAEYLAMNRVMLDHWKAPIINDFLCMVHFGILRILTSRWLGHCDENLQNDLLAGEGNLESAEPTKILIRYAGEVDAEPDLRKMIEETPDQLLMETLNQSRFTEFYNKIVDYVDRFGFRCMNEMKLEEKDLFSDPRFLFVCLKNYLRSNITDLKANENREKELRDNAEKLVKKELKGYKLRFYRWSLKHARKAVKNRENTRFARTRAYGIARSMFQSMGHSFAAIDILEQSDDVFFLTLQEIYGIHQGTLSVYDLKGLVALRRKSYRQYEDMEPKIRFCTRGPVYWQNEILDSPETPDVEEDADYHLKGLACCPGIIEGTVRVVLSPDEDLNLDGEILVAKRTDPGWVPLFPSVSGLLVERGSLLSHSAIVAREMGIPAIVGIKGLLNTLQTGMKIRFDGKTGTITILD